MTDTSSDPGRPARRSPRRTQVALGVVGAAAVLLGILLIGNGLFVRPTVPSSVANPPASELPAAGASSESVKPAARSGDEQSARPSTPTDPSGRSTASSSPSAESSTATPKRSALRESVPERVRIPAAGVDAGTVKLGIGEDGAMETPQDPDQVGWFVGGHTPGGPGVAVLAGHVTWNGRETVFYDLGRLDRGAQIVIDRKDGSTATFAITRRSTFPKDAFPTKDVYRASADPELVLITCGGNYDTDQHYYDSNVIAWAELVSITT